MSNNIHPFNFEEEEWPKENHSNVQEMELTSGGDESGSSSVIFHVKMRIIDGSESPELWCKFLESLHCEFDNTIRGFDNKVSMLKHLTKDRARRIVDETLLERLVDPTKETKMNDSECWLVQDKYYKNCIVYEEEWKSYTKTDEYKNDVLEEIIFKLRSCIFGSYPTIAVGCNALEKNRNWLRSLRFDPAIHGSIRAFSNRCLQVNRYSRFCPSYHTEQRGEVPRPLNDEELVEMLDGQLSDAATEYRTLLSNCDWDLYQHTYDRNISRLLDVEPSALDKIEYRKGMEDIERELSFRNDVSNSNNSKKRQRSNSNKSKHQQR